MTARQAYEAALELKIYCETTKCDACIFRTGRRGDVLMGCRLCEDNIPKFWELRYAKRRAKDETVY